MTAAANSKYGYTFRDGASLAVATGNYNSTVVPVEFLNSVQNLIQQVAAVRARSIKERLPAGADARSGFAPEPSNVFYVRTSQFIEPGLYRLQKSWEQPPADPGLAPDRCVGLLTDLGFAVSESHRVLTEGEYREYVQNPAGR